MVAGGILLFIPRLATLGAMVTFAAAVQIFTLNMMETRLFDRDTLLLVSRGQQVNGIQERPFNR